MNIEELHKQLPDRIRTEVSDQIQFFLRSDADQQMRFIIHFGKHIEFDILKRAIRLTILAQPVFSCFYNEDKETAWWQKQEEIDPSLLIDIVETKADIRIEITNFLTIEIQPFCFPIVRARVIRNAGKDVLCINMNHTPSDGSGLKEFVRILASIYTELIINPEFVMKPRINADRSLRQVNINFNSIQRLKFIREGFRSPKRGLSWSFDWVRTNDEARKLIAMIKIGSSGFERIKEYSRANNATINDVVLAGFIRTFVTTNKRNRIAGKPVIVLSDLRKYIVKKNNSGICNLMGSIMCNIGREIGTTFKETLYKVRDEMNSQKQKHSDMYALSSISVISAFMSYYKLKENYVNHKMPPVPLVSNIGLIYPDEINFDNIPVEDAFITGTISLGDFFCMAYSTFHKEMTFSIGYIGGKIQDQKVDDFLSRFKTELENIH